MGEKIKEVEDELRKGGKEVGREEKYKRREGYDETKSQGGGKKKGEVQWGSESPGSRMGCQLV